jgi:hypothetical protein
MANTASKPIIKLERIVVDALVSRGMTEGEAASAIERLKSAGQRTQTDSPRQATPKRDVTFTCNVVRRSDLAFLLRINGEDVWLPMSQLKPGSDPYGGSVTIPGWLAAKKGLVADG